MGTIKIKDTAGIIGEYDDDDEPRRFCPHCLEHGLYKILQERVYKPTKPNEPKQPLPRDHDEWLMCYHCGKVYAKWSTQKEDRLKQFAENIDSPFDSASNITGLDNKRTALTPIQKQRKKQLEEADKQKDPIIRAALRKGLKVEIIEDSLDF